MDGGHKPKANLTTISQMTGFSVATVSNALNRKKGVNAETSAIILRVAKELGYISEDAITKIRFIIYKKNGLIIEDTPFFSLIIDGLEKECRAQGFEFILSNVNQQDSDYIEQVKLLLNTSNCAAILLGTELSDADFELYKSAACPLLTLDYWCNDMSHNGVLINNVDSARIAVEYLIKKGHVDIGYLRGNFRIKAFHSRNVGYRQAMKAAGLSVHDEHIFTLKTTLTGAYQDMLGQLRVKKSLPTAFFADNDMIALGAMKALQEAGYRIPEDVSVIGFDDLPFSEISSPPLTTLRVPKQDMGRLAVRRVVDMLNANSHVKTMTQVCTSFVERNSVLDREK